MKRSGYRTVFHMYLIFFFIFLAAAALGAGCFFTLLTVQRPDGQTVKSDWPKAFADSFFRQIIEEDGRAAITPEGRSLLRDNGLGLQILDETGDEVFSYQKPENAASHYSAAELLALLRSRPEPQANSWDVPRSVPRDGNDPAPGGETTVFAGTARLEKGSYVYLIYSPVSIAKVTMYLNGERFSGGKTVLLLFSGIVVLLAAAAGLLYGWRTAAGMKRLTEGMQDISGRRYEAIYRRGAFEDAYRSLNRLNEEIRAGDALRDQTETLRKEWIANITHDLKTPLSPIKGYAELLLEAEKEDPETRKKYAAVMLKNVGCAESLIDDLKLTYQLESGIVPIRRRQVNLVRFLRELIIDILNDPEYEERRISFECAAAVLPASVDPTLLQRAVRNLVVNAFVHGERGTEVKIRAALVRRGSESAEPAAVQITVADNGTGIDEERLSRLFDRYYRGEAAERRPEGTGLGLAIVKHIVELHGGTISVSSEPGMGTEFQICLPLEDEN